MLHQVCSNQAKPNPTQGSGLHSTLCHRGTNSGQGCSAYEVCVCGIPGPSLLSFGSVSNRRAFDLECPSDDRLGKHSCTRVPVYLSTSKMEERFLSKVRHWRAEQQAEGAAAESPRCVQLNKQWHHYGEDEPASKSCMDFKSVSWEKSEETTLGLCLLPPPPNQTAPSSQRWAWDSRRKRVEPGALFLGFRWVWQVCGPWLVCPPRPGFRAILWVGAE